MPSPTPNPNELLDFRRIRRLAELMNQHDLSEIDLQQAEFRLRLRRGLPQVAGATVVQSLPSTGPAAPSHAGVKDKAPVDEAHIGAVTSPMVGTYYSASSPDVPPFVKVGDHVGPDTTVCIIEAMKVFNEIPAGISGRVIAVLAENGEPVEFGQPLFKIDTRG